MTHTHTRFFFSHTSDLENKTKDARDSRRTTDAQTACAAVNEMKRKRNPKRENAATSISIEKYHR